MKSIEKKSFDGRTYYLYEANANYGTLGPHTLTMVTTKALSPPAFTRSPPTSALAHVPGCMHMITLQKRIARRKALVHSRAKH